MSTQKGNTIRTRPQKYTNKTEFKNNLHDTSHNTRFINNLVIDNVCMRCKDILEWKIKYKKYKPLKAPSTCTKCHEKNVKQAYHHLCTNCSKEMKVCPKCGEAKELVESKSKTNEKLLSSFKVQEALKKLPERKRRTFYRNFNSGNSNLNTVEMILEKLNELSLKSRTSKSGFHFGDDFNDLDNYDDINDLDNYDDFNDLDNYNDFNDLDNYDDFNALDDVDNYD